MREPLYRPRAWICPKCQRPHCHHARAAYAMAHGITYNPERARQQRIADILEHT